MQFICMLLYFFIYNIHSLAIFTKKIKIVYNTHKIEDYPKKLLKPLNNISISKLHESILIVYNNNNNNNSNNNKTNIHVRVPILPIPTLPSLTEDEESLDDALDAGEIPWDILIDTDNKNNYTKYIK